MIPEKGHGPIKLHKNEDGTEQLKDNLSRLWCACGKPAVEYFDGFLPQYQFKCAVHAAEYREDCLVLIANATTCLAASLDGEEQLERELKHSQANMKMAVSSIEQKDKELEKCHTTGLKLSAKVKQLIAENERWQAANKELAKQNRIFHQDTNTTCDKLQAADERLAEQDKEIKRLREAIETAMPFVEHQSPTRAEDIRKLAWNLI